MSASILLVDDQRSNLVSMSTLLSQLGHPIVCASSGAEALGRLEEGSYALILLDGLETVVKIRAQPRWDHIPVVFLTAIRHDAEEQARGYALGAVDYIAPPFDDEALLARLRAIVNRHEHAEARERILGIVSHDLRSPLSTIRTGADYLLARADLAADQAKVVQRVQRNADRMARLINDLLDYTRLQSGPLPIRPRPASVADIVVESVEDIQQSQPRPIEVTVETRRAGSVDGDRLAQAVSNLVLNALQHSHAAARVTVALRERDGTLELSVWNEGVLALPDPTTLFLPFRRGERSSGMGLGLYISQQIARAHGGDLDVSSSVPAGTTFRMRLPAVATESEAGTAGTAGTA